MNRTSAAGTRTRVGGQSSRTRPPGPVSSPTAPVRRALKALFGGAVSKDTVSRVWRKLRAQWDAWNARSLVDEPVVRLILDGTVVDVRLDHKATAISLLVVPGVRMVRRCRSRSRPWAGRAATRLTQRPRAAPTFRIAAPQRDDAYQRAHSRCKNSPAASGIRPYSCMINMYLIRMLSARCRHRQNGP
jgi:hypothetical protein